MRLRNSSFPFAVFDRYCRIDNRCLLCANGYANVKLAIVHTSRRRIHWLVTVCDRIGCGMQSCPPGNRPRPAAVECRCRNACVDPVARRIYRDRGALESVACWIEPGAATPLEPDIRNAPWGGPRRETMACAQGALSKSPRRGNRALAVAAGPCMRGIRVGLAVSGAAGGAGRSIQAKAQGPMYACPACARVCGLIGKRRFASPAGEGAVARCGRDPGSRWYARRTPPGPLGCALPRGFHRNAWPQV
jgi:hypothetical protein